jgi:hypothetical protein
MLTYWLGRMIRMCVPRGRINRSFSGALPTTLSHTHAHTCTHIHINATQTSFALESVKDTLTTVDAMKGAHKALKTEVKKVKIDDIEVRLLFVCVFCVCLCVCVCLGWVMRDVGGQLIMYQASTWVIVSLPSSQLTSTQERKETPPFPLSSLFPIPHLL